MYMKPPTQCADDVSTVLGVSVVNELPGISFSFLSICLTLSTPDSLKLVTVSVTQRCAAIL